MSHLRARRRTNRRAIACGVLPGDLYGYISPTPRTGRPVKNDLADWTVTDDWPEVVPITEAEIDVFEAWFGDLFDELLEPCP
ncbi:hypothetical protein [Sphingopyxis flava]|uniref:Uncharacterized protein n=1 Tax=Sphingopyxis flava TaxID=1507287 RepID=A0A1T5D7R3_9SPHN|nr:hypothetical protein [Sphingopyxis flava]SKB67792.1 hypothetical protein SAMN06295937_101360 [Sphingopyxis flava]